MNLYNSKFNSHNLFLYNEGHSINKVNFALGLTMGSTVYSYNFFKEINSDGAFHVPKHCQHDLVYWLLLLELFYEWISIFSRHVLTFWFKFASLTNPFVWPILTKTCFFVHTKYFFCKFHMVCTLQPPKNLWQTSVQAWSIVWVAAISNSL